MSDKNQNWSLILYNNPYKELTKRMFTVISNNATSNTIIGNWISAHTHAPQKQCKQKNLSTKPNL